MHFNCLDTFGYLYFLKAFAEPEPTIKFKEAWVPLHVIFFLLPQNMLILKIKNIWSPGVTNCSFPMKRPNKKKISVFPVTGLKILGRVGTHILRRKSLVSIYVFS